MPHVRTSRNPSLLSPALPLSPITRKQAFYKAFAESVPTKVRDPTARKLAYKARSGVYTTTVKLAPGSYQYKFVIDGTWCADPENVNAVPNDHGTFNSVITVK